MNERGGLTYRGGLKEMGGLIIKDGMEMKEVFWQRGWIDRDGRIYRNSWTGRERLTERMDL